MSTFSERGFAHLLPVLVIAFLVATAVIPVTRRYSDGKSNVAGVAVFTGSTKTAEQKIEGKALEAMLKEKGVAIATAPGQVALVDKKVGALTNFPLSVDPVTKQLTVTTPAGTKVVAVLPQQAVNNMLASKVMDYVTGEKTANSLASIENLVQMEVKGGTLGYQVKGVKIHKVLGFIPIKTGVSAFVSAENGQIVETTSSLLGKILNRVTL